MRRVLVLYGKNDQGKWLEYKLHHVPSSDDSIPTNLFSYQPRIDHNYYYMAHDKFFDNYHIPYYTYGNRWFHRLIKLILLNDKNIRSLFRDLPEDFVPIEIKIAFRYLEFDYSGGPKWFTQIDNQSLKFKLVNLQFCKEVDQFPRPYLFESDYYLKRLKTYKIM